MPDIVACVAGDTNHVDSFRYTLENFSRFAQDAVYPYGAGGANASFALIAQQLHEDVRRAARGLRQDRRRAARQCAVAIPHALMKAPLTLEQYMSARPIADPIHLFDCVMPCAGAEALPGDDARTSPASLKLPAAKILSTIERHNAFGDDPVQVRGGWAMDVDELYAMAGVQPDDLDFVQTYDDYPVISMMQFEDLGFCRKGEGPDFVRQHDLTIDGSFPHNTSGGQLSVGQAGAGGAYLGVVEALRQVLGQAGPTQVRNARIGLASGFGMINYDRGLASGAAILAGPGCMIEPIVKAAPEEPAQADAAADVAAARAQPRVARSHRRGRRRGPLRAAALRRTAGRSAIRRAMPAPHAFPPISSSRMRRGAAR